MGFHMILSFFMLIFVRYVFGQNLHGLDEMHHQVYTCGHLEHLSGSMSGSGEFIRDTLLVLYTPECKEEVKKLSLFSGKFPSQPLFTIAVHDWKEFPSRIWFKVSDDDRLDQRYPPRACPTVYFLPAGHSGADAVRLWDSVKDGDLSDWVWAQMERQVTIINTCNRYMTVHMETRGLTGKSSIVLPPRGTMQQKFYKSDRIVAIDNQQGFFTKGLVVEKDDKMEIPCIPRAPAEGVIPETEMYSECDELSGMPMVEDYLNCAVWVELEARTTLISITGQWLHSLKNTHIVPKFTEVGYKKTTVPRDIYEELITFYLENKNQSVPESIDVSHLMNYKLVPTNIIQLNPHVKQVIAEKLRETMENWCNCSLVHTVSYGIREYKKGCLLRNHVDSLDTHVISVIMHIWKELDSAQDWPLELIDRQGNKQHVYLEPGEMLIYESTTLIHGRPLPFEGRLYANAFVHYKPAGWLRNFGTRTPRATGEPLMRYGEDGETEDIFPLETPLMDRFVKGETMPSAKPYYEYDTGPPVKDEL